MPPLCHAFHSYCACGGAFTIHSSNIFANSLFEFLFNTHRLQYNSAKWDWFRLYRNQCQIMNRNVSPLWKWWSRPSFSFIDVVNIHNLNVEFTILKFITFIILSFHSISHRFVSFRISFVCAYYMVFCVNEVSKMYKILMGSCK